MKLIRLLHEILREIFEESAYERFCARQGVPPGAASYASFLRESATGARPKVKCC
jgi:hypothetical protein